MPCLQITIKRQKTQVESCKLYRRFLIFRSTKMGRFPIFVENRSPIQQALRSKCAPKVFIFPHFPPENQESIHKTFPLAFGGPVPCGTAVLPPPTAQIRRRPPQRQTGRTSALPVSGFQFRFVSVYPLYPLGFSDCHFQEEAHMSSIPNLASQPSSSRALAGSA